MWDVGRGRNLNKQRMSVLVRFLPHLISHIRVLNAPQLQ